MLVRAVGYRERRHLFRTTRPPPGDSGSGWFWLGFVAIVRWVRMAGGLAWMACNPLSASCARGRKGDGMRWAVRHNDCGNSGIRL